MTCIDEKYQEYLEYLYKTANIRFPDCQDIDGIVQEALLAFFIRESKGEYIEHPKSYLSSILIHKYNDHLRSKYKNAVVSFENIDMEELPDEDMSEEYEAVRREIGRLIKIYREVTVLYYVHGKGVDEIAKELDIPKGTVLSRLSAARKQVKEGVSNMEKYSDISYEPKQLTLGIWGSPGFGAEPFSLVASPIEENILILAYEKPISIKSVADTMGIPCAFIEPIVEKLISGELMGETPQGLVYTRCFIQKYSDSLGDIICQKQTADKYAKAVWDTVKKHILPLTDKGSFTSMNEKQKVTFLLYMLQHILNLVIRKTTVASYRPDTPPQRPNGGAWLVTAKAFEAGEEPSNKYETSGPACCGYSQDGRFIGKMYDYQSFLGDTQYAYRSFRYNCPPNDIFAFLCSFIDENIRPQNSIIYELCEDFENIGILRKDENHEKRYAVDIPYMTLNELGDAFDRAEKAADELCELLSPALTVLWKGHINNVPKHVDENRYYRHTGALGAYTPVQIRAILDAGLLPYPVNIGKTPVMILAREV